MALVLNIETATTNCSVSLSKDGETLVLKEDMSSGYSHAETLHLFIDEVFIKIDGKQRYLWRAVDQDGEIVDVFLQDRRDAKAAKRFFDRLLKKHKGEPRKIVTDKLRSYGVAHRELIPDSIHCMEKYANNRAELSHQPTRVRERVIVGPTHRNSNQ